MKKVNVYLLRENLAKYLAELEKTGETIVVYKYKKPIATINLPKKVNKKFDYKKFFGFMGKTGETGVKYENRIRRGKKEKDYMKKLKMGIT